MRESFLPFHIPALDNSDVEAVTAVLRSGWITTGPEVAAFESEFGSFIGNDDVLALSSGTAALHLALIALGVGPGDKVATSVWTFCSAVHVIEHLGAHPIFVDVDSRTLNLDLTALEEVLETEHATGTSVKALIAVHFAGLPWASDPLYETCARFDVSVVEDAAHALPARDGPRLVGSSPPTELPWACCFSFYATKTLTTAEGGMLTGSPDVVDVARQWSLHGMNRDAFSRYHEEGTWEYDVDKPGFKYNMTDIQASLGRTQLQRAVELAKRRAAIAQRYTRHLSDVMEIEVPPGGHGFEHAWHLYVIRLGLDRLATSRSEFAEALYQQKVGTSVHFIPIHFLTYYRDKYGLDEDDFPIATREFERVLSLPIFPSMTDDDVDDVVAAIRDAISRLRRT